MLFVFLYHVYVLIFIWRQAFIYVSKTFFFIIFFYICKELIDSKISNFVEQLQFLKVHFEMNES